MWAKLIEVSASVSTPLALGGLFAAIVFYVFRQIVGRNIFPKLNAALGADLLRLIIERLFILSLAAMVLGFVGYLLPSVLRAGDQPPKQISHINMEGRLGRVESTDQCHLVGWVSLRSDDAVRIGLQATTWSSKPQAALIRVQRRLGTGAVYDDLPMVLVNVGSTGILGTVDGVTYAIRVSELDECDVHYVVSPSHG